MDTSNFHPPESEIVALASEMSRLEVQGDFRKLMEIVLSKKQKVVEQKEDINIINGNIKSLEALRTDGPQTPEFQELLELSKNARMSLLHKVAEATSVLQKLQDELDESIKEIQRGIFIKIIYFTINHKAELLSLS